MYLMALGNIDYIVITILFAAIFIIAYLFRRKNQTAALFIYTGSDKPFTSNRSLIGYGVLELIGCGTIGARYGISGIYYVILAIIISYLLSVYIAKIIFPNSLFDYIGNVLGSKIQALVATFGIIVLLFLAIATTIFTFKLFQPLLGWNYVNSIFGITGVTLIYVLLGGSRAVKSNVQLCASVVLGGILLAVILGVINLGGPSGILANLHDLAVKRTMGYNYYTGFNINFLMACQIAIVGLFLTMLSFLVETRNDSNWRMWIKRMTWIIPIGLMVMCGVVALATPITKNTEGSQIVTIQAQLPDGQTGYIVKAIDNDKTKPAFVTPGIIPPLLNPQTNLIEPNAYNYMLSSVVALKHYLPKPLSIVLVLVVLSAFMFALAQYLLGVSKLIVFDVYAKLGWFCSYGEIGKIWLTRMSIIFAANVSLFGGYFLSSYLDLARVSYIAGGFAATFCIFILCLVTYYGQTQKK